MISFLDVEVKMEAKEAATIILEEVITILVEAIIIT